MQTVSTWRRERNSSNVFVAETKTNCVLCKGNNFHPLSKCYQFKKLSVEDRVEVVKRNNLCFRCFLPHRLKECRSEKNCFCLRPHNFDSFSRDKTRNPTPTSNLNLDAPTFVPGQIEGSVEANSQSQFVATGFEKGRLKNVFLSTVRALVKNKYSQWVEVRCLLDVGSQSCLCTRACAEKLQLKMEKINTVVSCVNDASMVVKNCVKTSVSNKAKTFESELMLLVVNKITDLIPNKVIDVDVNVSEFVPLADDKFNIPDRIDMLLGAEIFYELLKPGKFYCDNSHVVLQNTLFGYVETPKILLLGDLIHCGNKRLSRDSSYLSLYAEFSKEYEELGHLERVVESSEPPTHYYIPHHGVLRPEKLTTKLRIVFNGSSPTTTGISLNDILLKGEVKEGVFETISRFKRHKFAFTTDIQKMYRQILINPDQQDLQRIIWKHGPDAEILTYRLKTVTYGLSNAPFFAIRTMQQLAKDEKSRFPLASETLLYDTYMDDIVSGEPDLETAQQLQSQLKDALKSCGMNLHKWSSNSPELLNSSLSSDVEHSFSTDIDLSVKTLGISWKPFEDCFAFKNRSQGFADASEAAYGAVVYLQCFLHNGAAKVSILASKSRVAPIRVISIPRLELCACVLLAQLFKKIHSTLRLNISDIVLHTDSTIALAWLNTPANHLKTFVANRVAKVQELTEGFQWNHVPSVLNPADLVSRGLRPCDLPNLRLWWHGPQFLEKGKLSSEEISLSPVKECEFSKELKTGSSSDIITSSVCVSTNCVSSILSTLLRKNSDGLLRVGGRLSNSDLPYVNKHPAILPGNHNLTVQIIVHFHRKNLHTGASSLLHYVREKFWPLNGRPLCRKVVHECLVCFKSRPLVTSQLMGNLPCDRVVPDYPFNCSAIHIEIVSDLTYDAFIATLKRFFSRRGKCAKLYSDNGKTFVGANKELKRFLKLIEDSDDNLAGFLSAEGIEWKFIPPRAPSFGGLWEASIKSIKYHLRVVSGSNLTYEEFLTVCIQIEGILNSRPLCVCPLSSNSDDLNALTPAHFLIGRSMTSVVEPNLIELNENALKKWQRITRLVQLIWNKWHRCYLSELQQRNKWQFKKQNVNVGDLVVLIEDNMPTFKWPLGRITEIYSGSDALIRVVKVKTQFGEYKRAISRVCLLPMPV
ncbi:integrase catalytic domain-containing protein [Trichonephila clavipes]|nr:integrase catalytic domain-containing protein [Trichonephila clavipes]